VPDDDRGVRLEALLLADYASTRGGLLTVVNAGVTRVTLSSVPKPAHLYLGLMFYLPPDQVGLAQQVAIALNYPETASQIGRFDIQFATDANVVQKAGEGLHVAFVIPLLQVTFETAGQVDIIASVNSTHAGSWSFWIDVSPRSGDQPRPA
jgi:Family of unknown function (DUF6941)